MGFVRFSVAALVSGLLHAAVLYSLTKLPQIPQRKEDYIRIDLSKIAFLKDEKTQAPPKVESRKTEHQRTKPHKISEGRLAEKPAESNSTSSEPKYQRVVAMDLSETKTEKEFTGESEKINKNTAEGGLQTTKKEASESSPKTIKKESGGESLAYSKPEPREDYEETYKKLNLSEIRKLIQESLVYPPTARKMGWEGKVSVEVVLTPEGCEGVSLKEKTGYEILDKNALETVKKLCSKFPKPQKKVVLLIPIVYKLN